LRESIGGEEGGRWDLERVQGMEWELGLVRTHLEELRVRQGEKLMELRQLREELEAYRVELESTHVTDHKMRTLQVCLQGRRGVRKSKPVEEAQKLQGELLKAKRMLVEKERGPEVGKERPSLAQVRLGVVLQLHSGGVRRATKAMDDHSYLNFMYI